MPDAITAFGLIAAVLMVAALASGIVDRAPISFPMIFLGLGFLLGENGLGYLSLDPHDSTLEVIGTISLALVMFLDAIRLRFDELSEDWLVPVLGVGPGTLLTLTLVTAAAYLLLDVDFTIALLFGAILSSTDPVVLRDVLRDSRIPRSVRRALSIESGTNDVIVLPTILVLIAVASHEAGGAAAWAEFLARLLLIGPLIGGAVGAVGAWLMAGADRKFGIRREYQALYGIGLVLAAYYAGDAARGDGFLAAFAAGVAVTVFDFELCDCFLEYGEVTAEMAMLVAFVLFGAVLSTMLEGLDLAVAVLFALFVIGVARPLAFMFVLRRAQVSNIARGFIAWFGPRGLASLLFALLVLHSDVEGAEYVLAVTGVVVIASVLLHGVTATPLAAWYGARVAAQTLDEEREGTAAGLFRPDVGGVPRISVDELHARLQSDNPPIVLDVRTRSQYDDDEGQIPGSIRLLPDQLEEWAEDQPRERPVVAYCT